MVGLLHMAIYSTSETEIYNTVSGVLVVKKKVISTNVRVQIPFANSPVNSNSNTIGYYNKKGLYVHIDNLKGNTTASYYRRSISSISLA